MTDKQPVIIIYSDGEPRIIGQVQIGAIEAAIMQLRRMIDGVWVGPPPEPERGQDDNA